MFIDVFKIILILMIVLLVFGAKKIPELVRSLRKSTDEFRQAVKENSKEDPEQS